MTAEAPLVRSASRDKEKFREISGKDRLDAIPENERAPSPRVKIEKDEGAGGADEKKIWGDEDTEPTEAIVRVLWGDFKAQTKRKIDEVMAFGIDEKFQLSDVFAMKADPGYHHLIDSLREIAKHSLNVLADALIQWKANQHTSPASLRAKMYAKRREKR